MQENLQCLDFFDTPELANMEPQDLLFDRRIPQCSDRIREMLPALKKSDMIILEVSTLRCCYYKGVFLNLVAMHFLRQHLPSILEDFYNIQYDCISIDECCDKIIEFHNRTGYKPILFLLPPVHANRLSNESAMMDGKIQEKIKNYPILLHFFDINQVVGLPEDYMKLTDDDIIPAERAYLFGGEQRIDYNHYSPLGKQRVTQGILAAIHVLECKQRINQNIARV